MVKTVPEYSYNSCYSYNNSSYFCKNIFCDDTEGPCVLLKYGHFGNQVIEVLHRAIKEYAKRGLNIAVDYLAYESHWAQDLDNCLKKIPHLWVKVHANPSKIIAREKNRAQEILGLARPYMNLIHANINYNFDLGTSRLTPQEMLNKVNEAIDQMKA